MERQMRDLRARLEDMETTQRCTTSAGDLSDSDSEIEVELEEEVVVEDASNEHLIRAIARMGEREKMDIPVYEGNLDAEEILD
jgi:rubrerythrin